MAFIIDKDEATAGRRRVPFRLFTSNGTSPDTNASNGTMLGSVNGAAQLSLGSISVVSANAGQYYFELSQSNVSVLGSIALYTDTLATDFPQHVATVQVVNNNPMSTLSALSNVTLFATEYSNVTLRIGLVNYSGATVGTGNIAPNIYSAVSLSIRDGGIYNSSFQADTYSNLTVAGAGRLDSSVTLRAVVHSGATVGGINDYANISDVTLHAGTHSDVTIQGVTRLNSNVTLNANTHSGATIQGLSNYANISNVTLHAGNHSAATIDGVLFVGVAGERSIASSLLSSPMGNSRILQEYFWPLRNRVQISGSTGTVFKPDDSTSAWTFSVTTADFPLSGIDPGGA